MDGVAATNIAGFDGRRWFPLRGGPELTSSAHSLAVLDGQLWCAGSWQSGATRSSVAVWEGGTALWSIVSTAAGAVVGGYFGDWVYHR